MKKTAKKIIALLLSVVFVFTLAFSSGAAVVIDETKEIVSYSSAQKVLWNVLDGIVNTLIKGITALFPPISDWSDETYCAEGFMQGSETFLTEKAENAQWKLGYDARSILLPEDEIIGKMYVAGTIGFSDKYADSIVDDLLVRTVALTDSSGRGTAVFACVDSYGLALSDVREIRNRLYEYAKANDINSITLSVLHQHSAVDTFGMNGNIWEMVFTNPAKNIFGAELTNGKNDAYMENLFNKCTESIKAATENMTEGKLYEGEADASKYINDKRQPYVMDESFTRLRFVPENGTKETWIITSAIHCVGNGAAGTTITGDYPYYLEQEIKDEANMMMVLGAEQSTSQKRDETSIENYSEEMTRMELTAAFGKAIAKDIKAISEEKEVEPILNIRYREILLPIDNTVLLLAGKAGLFENIIRKDCLKYNVLTEIGYMELGTELAVAIIPGELAPELAYGGCLDSEKSWSGKDWTYPSMEETVNENRGEKKLLVLGLANDQIGYIVPDNNYMPLLHEDSQSIEFVSLGKNTASNLMVEFGAMIAGLK